MDTPISAGFMPLAYALLLLRRDGHPCVFFGDLYGTCDPYPEPPVQHLPELLLARKLYAYGKQLDYFNRPDCIGWVRQGSEDRPDGLAVVMSWTQAAEAESQICMQVGREHAGEVWTDVLGLEAAVVMIDENGLGLFPCARNSMACFANKDAKGRKRFPVRFDTNFSGLLTCN